MMRSFMALAVLGRDGYILCLRRRMLLSLRTFSYIQGQSPKPNLREYFYYIDHQGQLFLDDAKVKNFISCFQDKDFLAFFFSRIRLNRTGRYEKEFPYFSPCGREKNYVRCDDLPIVYTHIITKEIKGNTSYHLSFGNTGDKLTVPFEPENLCMLPHSGRVYHPAQFKCGGIGLVKSKLAIELSSYFGYTDGDGSDALNLPSTFLWKGVTYTLTNELIELANKRDS